MKNLYTQLCARCHILIVLCCFLLFSSEAFAQPGVCNGGGCGFGGSQFPFGVQTTSSPFFSVVSTVIFAGEWAEYSVTAGCTYEWSLCGADGGSVSYDSQLTLYNSSNSILCYNDDLCGLSSKIRWTATYTGIARVQVTEYFLGFCFTNSTSTTLVWRQESCGGGAGCNSGTFWVSYTPTCSGLQETYTTCNFAGEYNDLFLTGGVTYTFGSSITSDFITVTNSVGGILTSGTQPVTYTPPSTGTYRIYYHTGSGCGTQSSCRSAWVQCGGGGFNPCSPLAGTLFCGSSTSTSMSGSGAPWNLTTCDGFTTTIGQERVFSFTPSTTGTYNINVSSISGGWVDFYYKPQSAGCNNSGWTCAGLTSFAPYTGTAMFLTAGVPYYILLDTEQTAATNITFQIPCVSGCDFVVPYSGSSSITTCSGVICDHASDGNYSDFANGFTIINPSSFGSAVRLTFNSFALECCCDFVNVFDGSGVGGTLLFSGNCTTFPPVITSNTGPLTIQFTSDLSIQNTGFSATISCVPLPGPSITGINPTSGCTGSTVTISGINLGGATNVTFNGVAASFAVVNSSTITATVPTTATTGVITVFTPTGNATSSTFTVLTGGITCPANISVNTDPGVCSAIVNYSAPVGNCGVVPTLTAGLPSGASFPVGTTTVTYSGGGGYPNGAGGFFTYNIGDSNQTIALKACESVYGVGNCNVGSCGNFTYYKSAAHVSCDCSKPIGSYEFIYSNTGYTQVGQDYGGAATNVAGNQLFTRVKTSSTCDGNSWNLAQEFLGQGSSFVTCSFTVTVTDNAPPTIICPSNISVSNTLNSCNAVVPYTPPVGSDNCPGSSTSQIGGLGSNATYPVGTTTNTFRVTASNGQTATCSFTVTVNDTQPPNAICQNISVPIISGGTASVTAAQINNNSTDNCGVAGIAIIAGTTSYTCANIGQSFAVTLRVTDINGNTATCVSNVTVTDPNSFCCSLPQAICQVAPVLQLNSGGTATLTVANVNNGSTANCGLQSITVSPTNFNCSHVGIPQTVTLTITDINNASSSCQTSLSVQDAIAPLVSCQNFSVSLSGSTASITTANVYSSGSDNCGTVNQVSVSPNSFTCANIGNNTVTLTVNDGHGNTATCSATVTVNDFTPPNIFCKNISVNLSGTSVTLTPASVFDFGNDNCGSVNLVSVTPSILTCAQLGFSLVQLSANDGNGNVATCNAFVNLIDVTPPTFSFCPADVTVDANEFCIAIANWTEPVVSDNCSATIQQIEGSPNGEFFGFGVSNVSYVATDPSGATANCSFLVTVQDVTPPSVTCYPTILVLITEGNANIVPANLFFFGSDNCGSVNLESLSQYSYACEDVGNVSVTLTVNDGFGNTNTCSSLVTVLDNNVPVAICKNITVALDSNGTATIAEDAVDDGSYDICGSILFDTDITTFTCANVGANTVVLTVDDGAGNSATCSAFVTVEDNTPPVALCQDVTVQLNSAGSGSINASEVDNGSSDACGVSDLGLSQSTFNCSHIGSNPNSVVLTVTDANFNFSTCSATVIVEDRIAPVAVCQNITVQLDVSGNATIAEDAVNDGSGDACGGLTFDTDITAFTCLNVGANVVVLTVTDAHGNSSTCGATVTVEDNIAPVAVCQNLTVQLDGSGNATIGEDAVNDGSGDACGGLTFDTDITSFTCLSVGTNAVVLTVTDAHGNSSTCGATVTVEDDIAPVAACQNITVQLDGSGNATIAEDAVNNGSSDACDGLTFDTNITTFTCLNVGTNAVVLTVTDAHGNSSTCGATVTVEDDIAPVAGCQNITVQLDGSGNATIAEDAVNNGSSDACGGLTFDTDITSFICLSIGANAVVLTVTDAHGNSSTCGATVTVEDNIAPVAVCQNITVQLDGSGNATITEDAVNNGSGDACGGLTFDTDIASFTCLNVGANAVVLTVTDAHGNNSTCGATVTVEDDIAPVAACQNITVQLDGSGNATIAEDAVNDGSGDACGGLTFDTNITSFTCLSVGTNAVVLTVTDAHGNSSTCGATVTVEDNIAPVATCQNITVQLDNSGNATIAEDAVNNGSGDACGGLTFDTDITSFTCLNVGVNAVVLTVTDAHGNSSTCGATVTIEDNTAPVAACQNITVQLDGSGNAMIAEDAVNDGSGDACGGLTFDTDITSFTCLNVGANAVVLTVTDAHGNNSTCGATVTVEDDIIPFAGCQNITVQLDGSGNATIAEDAVNDGSSDACGGLTFDTDITAFTCLNVGVNSVVLTVTDAHGNSSTCGATVTIEDNTAPIAACQNITVQLDGSGNATIAEDAVNNGSGDACGGLTFDTDITSFTCLNVGANSVVLTVTDAHGNSSTCGATVTIEDNTAPVAACQNITVQLDGSGNAMIAEDAVNDGSGDACGGLTFDTDITTFTCLNVGANAVVLTVTDAHGNSSTCGATVTVEDNIVPVAACQNITVQLDGSGNVTIGDDAVNNGSSDACGGLTFDTNTTSFNCLSVGANAVVLTVTDAHGNSSTCGATVTVEDDIVPVAACQNITVQLDASGNATIAEDAVNNGSGDACGGLTFDTDITSFTCLSVGANSVVLTVTDGHSNSSTCGATVTIEDNTAPVAACQNITVQLDGSGNATIVEDAVNNGSSDACGGLTFDTNTTSFTCLNVGANSIVLTVTDANSNSSTCGATVTIEDNIAPVVVCQNITVQLDNAGNATIAEDAVNNGSSDACGGLTFDTNTISFTCLSVGANAVVLTVTDGHSNSSTCGATVTIEDNTAPVAACQNITVQLDASGNATIAEDAVNNGSSDACGGLTFDTDITTFTCLNVGANSVVLTVTDAHGNSSTCGATVTVEDDTAPVAACQNITVQLDGSGNATIAEDAVNNGSGDACGGLTFDTNITSFTCLSVGANSVVLTVTDGHSNSSTCGATVTIEDNTAPVAACQNITVQLDGSGNATIVEDAVNNGSSDACGGLTFDTDITSFTCLSVGANAVVLTVTDGQGNSSTCGATVTVEDNIAPVAVCQNITVQLDGSGNATIAEDAVNNGSSDACGGLTFNTDITSFTCLSIGANAVVLTVTDGHSNSSTCGATVTIEDNTAPVAACQNITVQLDGSGNATIVEDAVNNGSSDACGGLTFDTDITSFTCLSVGANSIVLTVTDANSNSSTCGATVTIEDNTAPVAACQNITVQLDASGNATIAEDAVNNGSSDACGGLTFDTDITTFTCLNVGANSVVLTVTDAHGNSSTCGATVTVEDDTAPVAACQNITVQLDGSGNATIAEDAVNNGSGDACGGLTFDTNITSFTCLSVGANSVVLTVTDGQGNSSTCGATVTVEDNIAPVAVCQNITVQLDGSGNATIAEDAVNNGSSDACGGLTFNTDITSFTCLSIGANAVVLTVTDGHSNSSTCGATVTIEDNTAPVAVCQNITVQLDGSGNATIAEDAVNNGSSDACGGLTFNTDITSFTCLSIGANAVVLTVTDGHSNSSTCGATVTIEDNTAPVAACQNITVQLDGSGNATIVEDAVNNGSSDACGGLTFDTDITSFTCLNIGANAVVLTVTDGHGNSSTCGATVTVEDNIAPVAACQNITVQLDGSGNATIAEDAVNNGSGDACGGLTFNTDITSFTCLNIGANAVVLTVTDGQGNSSTCGATVTVEDNIAPVAVCQNITVQLDGIGNATITEDAVNNGSSDACGGLTFDTNTTSFTCLSVGANAVVLTVTDAHGNSSTCGATVTIEDNTAPVAACQNITVQLDGSGIAVIAEDAVNNGSSDACNGLIFDTNITTFTCSNVGTNAVVLTVTDANGNSSTCSATVTIEDNTVPVATCQNITVQLDNTGNVTVAENAVNGGSNDACSGLTFDTNITSFTCSDIGLNLVVLTAIDANSNSSTCGATVTIEDNTAPVAACQNITVQLDGIGNATITEDAVNDGSGDTCGGLTFDTNTTSFTCLSVGANAVVLTVTDAHGNSSTCGATVTVEDNIAPVAACQNITVQLDGSGNATIAEDAVNNGSGDACGGLTFDTDITSFTCLSVGANAVVLTVTDGQGNSSTCGATVTVEDDIVPVAACQNITVQLDASGNATIAEDAVNNGSGDACGGLTFDTDITSFTCLSVGANSVVLTVTDGQGNSSTCGATVTVEDDIVPVAACQNITVQLDGSGNATITEDAVNDGSTDACGGLTFDTDITSFTCLSVGANSVVLTVTDGQGNSSTCGATVTVEDDIVPVAACQNITVQLDGSGNATITEDAVNDGSTDACGGLTFDTDITSFTCLSVGANSVVLTVTDGQGNSSTCGATVTVEDNIAPVAVCQNITVQLDNAGNATIAEDAVNDGSGDTCGGLTFDTNSTSFTCLSVGANAVVLTVTDAHDNSSTCSATVTVEDNIAPLAVCQNITVQLDGSGNATITEDAVNDGSGDTCGGLTFDTNSTSFTCLSVGANAVVLTVTDGNGNSSTCGTTVTVEDNVAPVAVCQNITVQLDGSGNATIAEDAVNDGSGDACGGLTFDTDITTFTCLNVGANAVVLTVTDAHGNSSTCGATVTVEDNIVPVAACQNITVQLDGSGNATIAEDAVNNGSSDACGGLTFDTDITSFTCLNVGANAVVLTVTDAHGNSSTCGATVTVEDNIVPVAACQNITVQLDGSGNATIAEDAVNNGSSDACGGLTFDTDITSFTCLNVGANAVVLTVTDAHGNSSTCGTTVTVEDNVAPVAVCQNITVQLDGSGNATIAEDAVNNGSTDACGGLTFDTDITSFTCLSIGANAVVLTVTDAHGNSSTCGATVTVEDNIVPVAVCQNITVQLDGSGNTTITEDAVNNGSSDACGGLTFDTDITSFTCLNIGVNSVVLTVTDGHGNSSTCGATVTVEDNIAPVAACQNITVQLDGIGNATIAEDAVNNGSGDACGGLTFNTDITSFTCLNVGANAVVLTVTDAHGNSSTCGATVTVEDNIAPVAACQNITVQLDGSGNATIAEDAVNNGSGDACGGLTFDTDITSFTCLSVGVNAVVLTVTDGQGNSSTCGATVTVEDNIAPVAVCQNITVQLDGSGNATIAEDAVNDGSSDACGGLTFDTNITSFTCLSVGANAVVLTVTDAHGNSSTCGATVTVEDDIVPVAACQNITVQLDASGNATIAEDAVNNGSGDACGGLTFDTDITSFTCLNVGANSVVLTVTDAHGNSSTCGATVTIEDNIAPVAVCQNITVQLDGSGNATIAEDAVNDGSSDACGGLTFDTNITSFTCLSVGANSVVLTVTDGHSNSSTCGATVTIEDNTAPVAACQNITVQLDGSGNAAIVEDAVNNGSSDACGGLTFDTDITTFTCLNVGVNSVVLTVTDAHGNSSTCGTTVMVEDNVAPVAVCQNITVQLDGSGNATIAEDAVNDGSGDACGGLTFDTNITSFTCLSVGANAVVLTVTDAHGNSSTCGATVTVVNSHLPTITCPSNITQSTNANLCNAVVSWSSPTANDNCGIGSLSSSTASGSSFALGTTTVTYTVTNTVGNTATCSFTVTVNDTQAPAISCPSNIIQSTGVNNCNAVVSWTAPTPTDNCSVNSLNSSVASGSTFGIGTSTVTYTATDAASNTATCSFTVTINDTQAPIISGCPQSFITCLTQPTWLPPTATDNCSVISFNTNHLPGSTFSFGTTNVTYTATDAGNNTALCSFTVTVSNLTVTVNGSNYNGFGVSCQGGSNGTASTIVTGGSGAYNYNWSNSNNSSSLNGVSAGSYFVTVTDTNSGCTATGSVLLTQPDLLNCTATATQVNCFGNTNGSITTTVNGGVAPYNYLWSNGLQTSGLNGLGAGTYTLTTTDANGCACIQSITINQPPAIQILSGEVNNSFGNGTVPTFYNINTISFGGGVAPYNYTWNTTGYVQHNIVAPGEIEIVFANGASWSVTITDSNNCGIGQLVFNNVPDSGGVGVLDVMSHTILSDNGSNTGSVSVVVDGGYICSPGIYHYSWAGPGSWLASSIDNHTISGLPAGWYVVTVTDCGPDGIVNSGDEQSIIRYYWVPKQIRGRGKSELLTLNTENLQVYPNPFKIETNITFTLPETANAKLVVYDIIGKEVAVLFDGVAESNQKNVVTFSATDLPAGIYICRLSVSEWGKSIQKQVILIH